MEKQNRKRVKSHQLHDFGDVHGLDEVLAGDPAVVIHDGGSEGKLKNF